MDPEAISHEHLKKAFSLWITSASASRFDIRVFMHAAIAVPDIPASPGLADIAAVPGLLKGKRERRGKVQRNIQAVLAVSYGQVSSKPS